MRRAVAVAALAPLVMSGCGSKEKAAPANGRRAVDWPAFRKAILACEVKYVEQDHNRFVIAKLRAGGTLTSTAPPTEDIFAPLRQSHCKPAPLVAEE